MSFKVVPEIYCTDIAESMSYFTQVLGFTIKYERPDEHFAYLSRDGVDLMLEGLSGDSRKWITGELNTPFGRGINFQWDVLNIDKLYSEVIVKSPDSIYLALESKNYQVGNEFVTQKQFIVQVPDGYLFRFCED
ncbi:bleomycin resistance protein [Halomonas sp.]|uniref:bleomycin resistance protein n=1 Tax=Halomonas sp. TaxID=1486246 RepID=UPI003F92EFF1